MHEHVVQAAILILACCSPAVARSSARSLHQDDVTLAASGNSSSGPWLDSTLPIDQRVEALLAALTPQQKAAQLQTNPDGGVPELGLPPVSWQAECGHGYKVGGAGDQLPAGNFGAATIYPQNMVMGATFNDALIERMAGQIGDEMRAHRALAAAGGEVLGHSHCLSPHVTLARDARWGRMAEVYGEDPLLLSRMAAAYVRGLQGPPDAPYVKVGATCKHFLGHILEGNWKGTSIRNLDTRLDERDVHDSLLPPFQACAAQAAAVMCSYNAWRGTPSCASKELLTDLLRGQMGFQGFVVTDKFAVETNADKPPGGFNLAGGDLHKATALAFQAGTDMLMKNTSQLHVEDSSAAELDAAVRRVLRARFRLGDFDPPTSLPWAGLNASIIGSPEHAATARQIAAEGTVLLKNEGGALPLHVGALKRLAVLGPFADQADHILGTYVGAASGNITTPLAALRAVLPGVDVSWDASTADKFSSKNAKADAERCEGADVCVLFLGSRLSRMKPEDYEKSEESAYLTSDEGEGRDRKTLHLQPNQRKLWETVAEETAKPLIVVLFHGGPLDVSDMLGSTRVGAILSAGMPGQHGAAAIADILVGATVPSGRVPVSWYRESYMQQLDPTDQRMRASADGSFPGRTYRYWLGETPLFPFGFGLSYVQWRLSDAAFGATGNGSTSGGCGGGTPAGASSGSAAGELLAAGESSAAELGVSVDLEGDSVALGVSITVTHAGSANPAGSSFGSGSTDSSSNMTASTSVLLFMRLLDGGAEWGGGGSSNRSSSSGSSSISSISIISSTSSGGSGGNATAAATGNELPLATISGSGCSWAASSTDVVQQLVGYARTGQLAPGSSQRLTFRLQLSPPGEGYNSSSGGSGGSGGSSWAGFGDPEPPCGLYGLRFGHDQPEAALVLLD